MARGEQGQSGTVSKETGAEPHHFGKGARAPLFDGRETRPERVQETRSERVRLCPPKNRRKGRDGKKPPNPPPSGGQDLPDLEQDQTIVPSSARVAGRNPRALGTNPRARRQLACHPELHDAWLSIMAEAESSNRLLAIQLASAGPEVDGDRVVLSGPTATCLLERYAVRLMALAERHGLQLEQRVVDAARRITDRPQNSATGERAC